MLRSVIEVHESDGSSFTVKDECDSDGSLSRESEENCSDLQEPCDITFPQIKEEIKWDPEELESLASTLPGLGDGWMTGTNESQLNDQRNFCAPRDVDLGVIDLTHEEPTSKAPVDLVSEQETKQQLPVTGAQNEVATAGSSPSKICRCVACSEEMELVVTEHNSLTTKCVHVRDRGKSQETLTNSVDKTCSSSVCAGRPGDKKMLVAQGTVCSERKSCSCASEREICALHPDRKKHFCSLCGAMFLWEDYLDKHMASHAEEMPYSCSICSSKFRLKESLEKHMRFHPGSSSSSPKAECKTKSLPDAPAAPRAVGAPFGCAICNLRFLWQEQLRNHLVAHPDKKMFFCAICGSKFPAEEELFVHVAGHSENKQYACAVCNAVLDSQKLLDSHMSGHSAKEQFPCSSCRSSFASSKLLECHVMLSHAQSEQRPRSSSSKVTPTIIYKRGASVSRCSEDGAAAKQERDSCMRVVPQEEKHLRVHTAQGVTTICRDFSAPMCKNSQTLEKSIICEKTASSSFGGTKTQNGGVVGRHTQIKTVGEQFYCWSCNARFNKKITLESHIALAHSLKRIRRDQNP